MADRIVVMHDGRIQQDADPLTISTRPENELVASFMGDNNILRGTVSSKEADRLLIDDGNVKISVRAPGSTLEVGTPATVSIRAAAIEVHDDGARPDGDVNHAVPEIIFVEYLGDLVKLHLSLGGERLLAKVTGDRFPQLRGREGSTIAISWKEEDVQLLGA
jgi:putative spermidine/putrescine transport system ATP-binding protein